MRKITEQEILEARTRHGGWTRATLAGWGVPWPPPDGWKDALINGTKVPAQTAQQLRKYSNSVRRRKLRNNP
jgi:hypothetical protein